MAGRSVPDPGFAGDRGEPNPRLAAALAAYAVAAQADGAAGGRPEAELLAALATARVLVPVVAVPIGVPADSRPGGGVIGGEVEPVGEQLGGQLGEQVEEKGTDMALATLVGADGRRALPVFTCLQSMAAWDAQARPVPVQAARAAQAAVTEDAPVLVLDVAGPVTHVVPSVVVRALARGHPMRPVYDDPSMAASVAAILTGEGAVREAYLLPAVGRDARLGLVVDGALSDEGLRALAVRVAHGLRQEEALRSVLVRGLDLALLPASPAGARPAYRRAADDGT